MNIIEISKSELASMSKKTYLNGREIKANDKLIAVLYKSKPTKDSDIVEFDINKPIDMTEENPNGSTLTVAYIHVDDFNKYKVINDTTKLPIIIDK